VNHDATVADVQAVIAADTEGFWLLIGDIGSPDEPRKREALLNLISAAMGKGYERGLQRGGEMVVSAVRSAVGPEPEG
jgi:hypothetical protein